MSWKPKDAEIIDYLYDNLKLEENDAFESKLKAHPEIMQDIEELRKTLNLLPVVEDQEVIPAFRFNGPVPSKKSISIQHGWLSPISIAAAVALLLVTGYLTQFRLSFNQEGVNIGFFNNQPQEASSMSKEEIESLVALQLNRSANVLNEDVLKLKSSFAMQLEDNKRVTEEQIKKLASQSKNIPLEDEQILNYMAQLEETNREMMQNFYKVSVEEQQKALRNILFDYSNYLEKQRQEDLQIIQANLLNMKNNSEIKQEETDKLLANIISTVNNKYSLGQ